MPGKSDSERIRRLIGGLEQVAAGDYSVRLVPSGGDDDLESLARSIQKMAEKMGERAAADAFAEAERDLIRLFLERISVGVARVGPDARILSANERFCGTLGYTRDELCRMSVCDVDPAFSPGRWASHFQELRTSGSFTLETRLRRKDGTLFPAEVTPTYVESHGHEYLITFLRDISERKRVEESLLRARSALDRARDPVYWVAPDGSFLYVNEAACLSMGYGREELLRMTVFDIDPQFPRETWPEHWRRSRELGAYQFETFHKTRSGNVFPVEIGLSFISFGEEEFHSVLVRDITERKRVEGALRESEYFLRKSQEVSHLGSYSMDVVSGKWFSSPMLDEIFGIDAGHPKDVGSWLEIVAPDQREEMGRYLEQHVLAKRNRFDREYRIIRKNDRQERWVHGLGELEKDERGAPVRMIGTIQDVTDRKREEMEREALESQLRQAQKMESIGRLAGGVAHDFNNMLAVILGYSELIRLRLPPGDPLLKNVQEIEKAAGHSRDVTRQLLAFSRKQIIAPKAVNLNDLLKVMQKTLSRLIGEDIDLRFLLEPDLWNVRVDPSQFDQVLVNLAVNARDAMPRGGRLTIETANVRLDERFCIENDGFVPGDYILLGVSDDGVGMDRETEARIFEPFFTTKEVGKGTGLGLSTVYGIIKQNGGFINVYSQPGIGTTFKIHIPRLKESVEADEVPDETAETLSGIDAGSILLVEDDDMVRKLTATMLEEIGYTVRAAETPLDAIALCEKEDLPLDLLITDVIMPGMNGRELWKTVETVRPGIGVLYMSGYTPDIIAHQGILEDGVHFIHKPFTRKALARKVREAFGRP